MYHGTISGIGTPICRCDNCGATGTFAELNAADDCPKTTPLEVEPCPTCDGIDHDCQDCDGYGVVTLVRATEIKNRRNTEQT